MAVRNKQRYRKIWLSVNELPAPCWVCGELVRRWGRARGDGQLHHLNEDYTDDRIENLVLVHLECHTKLHLLERITEGKPPALGKSTGPLSEEHRRKISVANTGKKRTPEQRAAQSVRQKGRTMSEEQKKAIGDTLRGRRRAPYNLRPKAACPDCGAMIRSVEIHRRRVHLQK